MRKMKTCDFQWIGQIPEDWMMTKVKFVADFYNGDRGKNYPSGDDLVDDGIVFLTSNNIHSTVLDTNPEITKYITLERYKLLGGAKIRKGDLIFCLRGSVGLCSINESENEGTVASSLTVLRPKNINNHFLNFTLNSKVAEIQTKKFENGSCAANLSAENVGTYIIPFPPLAEQQKIADFLDEKCGEIDSIRSDVQREIEILNDYKKSVITEAVTKGLNPKAKLKDSGIEWIGKIPEGWNVFRIKYLATEPNTLFTDGDWINGDIITEDGVRYLTSGNVGEGKFKYQGEGHISLETFNEMHCLRAVPGDLMICRLNLPIGRCCIIPDDEPFYVIAVDNVILRPNSNVDKKYAMYCMNTPGYAMEAEMAAGGTTMKRISRTDLGNLRIPVPPLPEQKAIADYLDEKCSEIDATIADKQKQLETLDEYKKSLIFEYVTGKKEIS